jgi:hypothetical protein
LSFGEGEKGIETETASNAGRETETDAAAFEAREGVAAEEATESEEERERDAATAFFPLIIDSNNR